MTHDPSDEEIVVLVTVPGEAEAVTLARAVVEDRLVACVNILPAIRSVYRWKGEVCDDPESMLIMKTLRSRFDRLTLKIRDIHPYEIPEMIALPIRAGWPPYLVWLRSEVADPAAR